MPDPRRLCSWGSAYLPISRTSLVVKPAHIGEQINSLAELQIVAAAPQARSLRSVVEEEVTVHVDRSRKDLEMHLTVIINRYHSYDCRRLRVPRKKHRPDLDRGGADST